MSGITISQVNQMDEESFVASFGPVFEHSPWIARRAWPRRPFPSVRALHFRLCEILHESSPEEKLALLSAHPDLGERLAALTPESAREQQSAGLHQLTQAELETFASCNLAYKKKFGFPFIICARLSDKTSMLNAFDRRLQNSREVELGTALEQIEKIADLRLRALVSNS